MNSMKLFVVLLTIFGQIYCDESNENSNEDNDSNAMICFFEFPNAIIKTDDHKLYLLIHKHFWVLNFDSNTNKLSVRDSNATLISEKWQNLPNDVDLGFTVENSSYGNTLSGHTFFVKREKYYLYKNQEYIDEGTTKYWGPDSWLNWRYVVTLRNSSLVLLSTKGEIISSSTSGKSFSFDEKDYPEIKSDFSVLTERIHFETNNLKFLFPLPFDDKYLAFFQTRGEGFYCVLQNLEDQIFNCPAHILLTKQNDWIFYIWKMFGLNIHELLIIIFGSSFAVLSINLMLFIVSFERYIQMI